MDDTLLKKLEHSSGGKFRPAFFFHPAYDYVASTPMHRNSLLLSGARKVSSSTASSGPNLLEASLFNSPKLQWSLNDSVGNIQHQVNTGQNYGGYHPPLAREAVFPFGPMVHPNQGSAGVSQHSPSPTNVVGMAPQRSQNIQINSSNFATADSCPMPGTSLEQSSTASSNLPVQHNNWLSSPENSSFNFDDSRLISGDSLYPTLDLNCGGASNDILEYLPTLEDSKGPTGISDNNTLMWDFEPEDDQIPGKLLDDKPWMQQVMDYDSSYKTEIKSEAPVEPTLAELNSTGELDEFDVDNFFMDNNISKKEVFNPPSNEIPLIAEIKLEPNLGIGTTSDSTNSWSASSFAQSLSNQPAGSSSASSNLQALSPTSSNSQAVSSQSVAPPSFSSPLPPPAYSSPNTNLASTSTGLPGKQHMGGGKATSRSFLHPSSPLQSPNRKGPLGGKPKTSMLADRLSTSAPSTNNMELWKARKAEVINRGRLRHGSTDTTLSQLSSVQLSMDDGFSSQADEEDDSDNEDRSSGDESGSDNDHDGISSPLSPSEEGGSGKKKGKYFWQYNVQAKGPKGPRMKVTNVPEDPHVLADVTDPVFSPDCQLEVKTVLYGLVGVKHAGKARRGDGNDLTPNPNKLHNIGVELDKLTRIINELTPPTDLPFNARNKSRKEKNKLASRACRLKKKAQHEANKLKLYGLQVEHKLLLSATAQMRQMCIERFTGSANIDEHPVHIENLISKTDSLRVAGRTPDYVNKTLQNVANGVPRGGIDG